MTICCDSYRNLKIPIALVEINYAGYDGASGGTVADNSTDSVILNADNSIANLLSRGGDVTHTISGLNMVSHYEFSVSIEYANFDRKESPAIRIEVNR